MAFSRALLLKGLAGAAAVGAVGGGVVLGGNLFNSNKRVNRRLGFLGIGGDCLLKDDEDSTNFSKECDLDLGKLKKIRFSNKGEGELTVKGEVPQELKLKIEGTKEGISFFFKGVTDSSPISIFGDESKGKIVLRSEEQKFKEKGGKLTKESASVDETLKGFNKQLGTVKAPIECRFDEAETDASVECPVTEENLKGIKFSGLEEGELKVKGEVSAGLKLKAERDQENTMSLYFTGLGENLTIYGDQKSEGIVIKSGKKFRVGEDGKLEKVTTVVTPELKAKLGEFNKQLEKVKAPLQCRFDEEEGDESVECPVSHEQLKKMEFSNKLGKDDLRIVGSVDPGLKLRVERDSENVMSLSFPQQSTELQIFGREDGGKIILKNDKKFKVVGDKLTKENSNAEIKKLNEQLGNLKAPIECRFDESETEASVECTVTQDQFKTLGFSNKGDGTLTIKTWPTSGEVKLKVDKEDQNAMSLSFPGLEASSSSPVTIYGKEGKIVIKNEEQKFTVVDNKLTKGNQNAELKKFNKQLLLAKAPIECRFDDTEASEESVECSVSEEQLKTMAFSDEDSKSLTLSDKNFSGMKLEVQIVKKVNSRNNEESKELILTFKDYKNTVKIMSTSGDVEREVVSFVKNTNPEFVIDGYEEDNNSVLMAKNWDEDAFEDLLGLECTEGSNKWECVFNEDSGKINVGKGTGDEFGELNLSNLKGKNFEIHKDIEDYNQGFKFVFGGTTVSGTDGSGVSLEQNENYEFKWKAQAGKPREYYLVKRAQ